MQGDKSLILLIVGIMALLALSVIWVSGMLVGIDGQPPEPVTAWSAIVVIGLVFYATTGLYFGCRGFPAGKPFGILYMLPLGAAALHYATFVLVTL